MAEDEKRQKLKHLSKERTVWRERIEILENRVERLKSDITRLIRGKGFEVDDNELYEHITGQCEQKL